MLAPLIARRLLAERVLLLQPPLGLKVDPPVDVPRDHAPNVVVFRSDGKVVPPSVRKVAVGRDVLFLWQAQLIVRVARTEWHVGDAVGFISHYAHTRVVPLNLARAHRAHHRRSDRQPPAGFGFLDGLAYLFCGCC